MTNFRHILLIPIGILATAVILKSSGAAIYQKNVNFKILDEQIHAEIVNSFCKTMSRLSHFEMDAPAKIIIKPMKNEEGNTFNEPFLVGNSHEIRAHHYMPPTVDNWCSGVVSKHTHMYFEHQNRRISVVFDCNRKMVKMAAWSCLPPEIKLNVIRNLDFMSRKSLRCVSYSDREIVDSTIFTLPRVRFGYKKGRCLIVIYTAIEKFLRWEMEMDDGFINYYRSENNFDPGFLVKITHVDISPGFPDAFMLMGILSILTSLVSHKSIQIKTMEWELPSDGLSEREKEIAWDIIDFSIESKPFRVEELVHPECNDGTFGSIVMKSINVVGLKSFRCLGIVISGESLVPEVAHEFVKKMENGLTCYKTILLMKDTLPTQVGLMHNNFKRLKMNYEKECPSRAKYRSLYNKYETDTVKRKVENDGLVCYITETKCGCTIQKIHPTHEKEFLEEVDIKKCGLGDLCKRCADPFEYWYTQNLPRRFHYEPFWNGIRQESPVMNTDEDLQMVLLKVKLEKYEKEKARIQKIVDEKRGKVGGAEGGQCSWGFDKNKYLKLIGPKSRQYQVSKDLSAVNRLVEESEQLGISVKVNDEKLTVEFKETAIDREYTVTKKNTVTQEATVTEEVKGATAAEEPTVTQCPNATEKYNGPEVTEEDTETQLPTATEEVKESLMIQESIVTQDATVTVQSPSLLKYLLVLLVIPIALAIIFAFL